MCQVMEGAEEGRETVAGDWVRQCCRQTGA